MSESPNERRTPGAGSMRHFLSRTNTLDFESSQKLDVDELEDLLESFNERISGTYHRIHTVRDGSSLLLCPLPYTKAKLSVP
jgi:hypothetical protein